MEGVHDIVLGDVIDRRMFSCSGTFDRRSAVPVYEPVCCKFICGGYDCIPVFIFENGMRKDDHPFCDYLSGDASVSDF